jgi:hypothetical protein
MEFSSSLMLITFDMQETLSDIGLLAFGEKKLGLLFCTSTSASTSTFIRASVIVRVLVPVQVPEQVPFLVPALVLALVLLVLLRLKCVEARSMRDEEEDDALWHARACPHSSAPVDSGSETERNGNAHCCPLKGAP